ncbi:MAG: GT4 family glycosyltransferase PelF [Spirochaetales bacterium]|nr:GT4 family glycosyltransferase PelF [Spirochaetales bacterium]
MTDVCLILEGTYPYIAGGVSTWVHHLIKALPHLRFSLVTIMPGTPTYLEPKYEVPDNVVSIQPLFIHHYRLSSKRRYGRSGRGFRIIEEFYRKIAKRDYSLFPGFFRDVLDPGTRVVSPRQLFYSRKTWRLLLELYRGMNIKSSFIDFFWTWRFSHLPLLMLLDVPIPPAAVYHTICTGYAGLLAVLAHFKTGKPFFITEHGIYTNERRIEIEQSSWIYDPNKSQAVINEMSNPFKDFWTALFDHLGRLTYKYSTEIITLFEANQKMEIEGGAPPGKIKIIPNGIDIGRYNITDREQKEGVPGHVGFVGRVVPIKDVKTFIKSCKIIADMLPRTRFSIAGPVDEDPVYFKECKSQVVLLGLEDCVTFTGRVNVLDLYRELDVVVLTSISEAQPLVILEANCCGIPCVATEVGSCRELLYGRTPRDMQIGQSGYVTPLSDPQATADAVIQLLTNSALRRQMGLNGRERVKRYYNIEDLNFIYKEIYQKYRAGV